MNTIQQNDLQILSQYHFVDNASNRNNANLIGVKWINEGSM